MTIGAIPSPGGVEAAIRRASNATGVDADFLIKTARRESAMNPSARARTSSAAGLFQFIEQTWLGTVKAHGAKHGYGQYAAQRYSRSESDPSHTPSLNLDRRVRRCKLPEAGDEILSCHAHHLVKRWTRHFGSCGERLSDIVGCEQPQCPLVDLLG